jgi:transcriptional regulator GlxA family with amidase domain
MSRIVGSMSLRTCARPVTMRAMEPRTPGRPLRIALFAYPGVQALDLSGPLEMFARATRFLRDEGRAHPGYSLAVVGTGKGPLSASSGFRFLPDTTFRALRGSLDTLLVVGGRGIDAVAGDRAILGWLRRVAGRVRRLGSVCTGAFLLAEAGLLDGRTATTHWSRAAELARRYPRVRVEEDRIWVRDGNLYTSAGVTAGMDLALALIEEDLGAEVALAVARAMVMYLRRPGDQSQYSAPLRLQAAETPSLRALVAWATEHPAGDLSVPALAQRVGKSPRHLTRVFRRELGIAPAEAVEQLRLEAARRALQQSAGSLDEVAARCGFGSAEVLRRVFLRALHVTPSAYRARFAAHEAIAS